MQYCVSDEDRKQNNTAVFLQISHLKIKTCVCHSILIMVTIIIFKLQLRITYNKLFYFLG